MSGVLIGVFSLAAITQARLQVLNRAETIERANKTKRFSFNHVDYARRGSILAADGKPLAQDQEVYELNVEFEKVPHADGFYVDLAAASGIPASEFSTLAATLAPGRAHRDWRRPISPIQAKAIIEVRGRWRADGLSVRRLERRSYPMGPSASGIVGEVKEGKALSGLEAGLDKTLHGTNGEQMGLTDRFGEFLPLRDEKLVKEKHDGRDVQLTIDRDLQAITAAAVKHAVERNFADQGVGIVLDPRTGDILAMANWPSFEPYAMDGSDGDRTENSGFNIAVRGALEPGSTFKILTLAMAIDSGHVNLNTTTFCPGEYHPSPSTIIHCDSHHGSRAHLQVTPEIAIAKSCNVSAAMWAASVGRDEFCDYVDKLGLTEPTRIGFTREAVGSYARNEHSWRIQLANMAFGQSITATPIALASAFATLANGGVRVPPRLIKRLGDEETAPREPSRVFSEKACADVMKCMEAVVQGDQGTGKALRIPGYRIAGKTGTAQKHNDSRQGFVGNFIGVVPAQNPKAVILVMIDHPHTKDYYGASVAGPAFDQIARAVIRRYSIPPTEPFVPTSTKTAAHKKPLPAKSEPVKKSTIADDEEPDRTPVKSKSKKLDRAARKLAAKKVGRRPSIDDEEDTPAPVKRTRPKPKKRAVATDFD